MKATGINLELEIRLSNEEISLLEKETINGEIKVYDRDEKIGIFPLKLRLFDIDKNQL